MIFGGLYDHGEGSDFRCLWLLWLNGGMGAIIFSIAIAAPFRAPSAVSTCAKKIELPSFQKRARPIPLKKSEWLYVLK